MASVFISYSHKDAHLARQVHKRLSDAGHEVWRDASDDELDQSSPEGIASGLSIPEGIANGLERCDYLVILITRNSLSSGWMKREINTFLMDDSKWENVLPLRFDDTEATKISGLLRAVKSTDLSDFDAGISRVLQRLGPSSNESSPNEAIAKKEDWERLLFAVDLALRAGSVAMRFYNSCLIGNSALDERKNAATAADKAAQLEVEAALKNHSSYRTERLIAEEEPYNTPEKVELNGYTWVIDPLDGTTNFQNRIPFFCTAIGVLRNGLPHIGAVYDPVANEVYYAIEGSQTKLWSISRGEVSAMAADQTTNVLSGCLAGTHISSRPEVAERLLEKGLLLNIEKKVKHLRAFGCGQLALAYVASARMQLFFQFDSHLWDQVAGIVLVRNSKGGSVSKIPDGKGASGVLGENWTFSTRDFIAAANPRVQSEFLKLLT